MSEENVGNEANVTSNENTEPVNNEQVGNDEGDFAKKLYGDDEGEKEPKKEPEKEPEKSRLKNPNSLKKSNLY